MLPAVFLFLTLAACSREAPRFSLDNARAHVQMLAGTIGSRPLGTPENAQARQYVIDQLRLYGFDVRVQETDARRPDLGLTARVSNIIAVKAGADRNAIGLISHYDSSPEAPGAADDGLGVAVSLEAARVLGARQDLRHTLMVLVTDGEESGLMGAAGLVTDRDVMARLNAYINIEATGSGGNALLFEAGPGNGWLVKPWARWAPHPRGASFAIEIYKRLPNDTDFSIFKRHDLPGLNFAAIGDSYSYHTARDTADRLDNDALSKTGENVVQTVLALDPLDLRQRSTSNQTYFDVGRTIAVSWGPTTAWLLAAEFAGARPARLVPDARRLPATDRGLAMDPRSSSGRCSASPRSRARWSARRGSFANGQAVYHPWYARPDRLFLVLLAVGTLAGWLIVRVGALLPARAHAARHPMLVWSLTLPLWVAAAGFGAAVAPSAGYLWSLPLFVAGLGLLVVPAGKRAAGPRRFGGRARRRWIAVAVRHRRASAFSGGALRTPADHHAGLDLRGADAGVRRDGRATLHRGRRRRRDRCRGPSLVTAALLVAVAVTLGFAYFTRAYTYQQPQRRLARVLVEPSAATATYEVGVARTRSRSRRRRARRMVSRG